MTFLHIMKLIFLIFLIVLFVREYIFNRKNKQSILLGLLLMVSMVSSPAPWTSLIIECILLISWLCLYKFKASKNKNMQIIFYYILPIFIYILSYSLGLIMLYGLVSFLVLFKIYEIILALLLVSLILYLMIYIFKCISFKFKENIKFKDSFKNCESPIFILYLILPYLALILI